MISKEVGGKSVYCESDIIYNCLSSQQLAQKEQE